MTDKKLYYYLVLKDDELRLHRSDSFNELPPKDCTEDVFISMILEQRAKRLGKSVDEYLKVVRDTIDKSVKSC